MRHAEFVLMLAIFTVVACVFLYRVQPHDPASHPISGVKRSAPARSRNCVPYPYYPSTVICNARYLYHLQKGGKAFMADLWKPHAPLPALHRVGLDQ